MSILKLPYALIISVIVGVTNMIPYFGPFIGAVPGILLLLFVSFKYALIFTVLIIVLQQFDGLYLGPKILGESTGLRPLWIIFAITVGGSMAGVLGMFLGVPTLAVIAYILNYFIEKRLHKYGIFFLQKEEPEEPAGRKNNSNSRRKYTCGRRKLHRYRKKSRVNLLFLFAFFICPLPVLSGILPFLPYGGW